jgi:epoxyqueuosine reductase QueG
MWPEKMNNEYFVCVTVCPSGAIDESISVVEIRSVEKREKRHQISKNSHVLVRNASRVLQLQEQHA